MIGRFAEPGAYRELLRSADFIRTLLGGALALAAYLMETGSGAQSVAATLLALFSVAVNGLPIIRGAVTGVLHRRVNVDELVSLAIIACLARGEFLTAAVVSFIMVMGSLVEQATTDSARKAIRSLMSISPQTAIVLTDGVTVEKPIQDVKTGEILLVRPGDRNPVDAVIRRGRSAVDESSMTGEPIPVDKEPGDPVYAGTMNLSGVVEVEATRVGEDTTLGMVIRLVTEAEKHKPRAVKVIDRYAKWFTPLIIACAAFAWWLTGDPDRAVTVLIAGCPCALILAAPTAVVAAIGRAARSGILVKGGQYLEEAGRADVVLFDKTGTLTRGKPRVNGVFPAKGVEALNILTLAACVEQHSTHPLARAILKAAHYARVTIGQADEMCARIGLGVRGRVSGNWIEVGSACMAGGTANMPIELCEPLESIKEKGATPLLVYRNERPLGLISVADEIRPCARETVAALCSMNIDHVGILSGDHERSACMIAESVGLDRAWAQMMPEDKPRVVKEFQQRGKTVLFVGDGINDAPALATANVGIAMGDAGTNVALEASDIALMNDDISKIPFLIRLGRRMLTVIKRNIALGMLFNVLAVAAGGAGFLSPIMGALVHNIGSVVVVISSASMAFAREK